MKVYILLLLNLFFASKIKQVEELPLLKPTTNFKFEILDCISMNDIDCPDPIILLRIRKKTEKNTVGDKIEQDELAISLAEKKDLQYYIMGEDKYWGYFEYNKRIVLVLGNNVEYFFTKTKTNRRFDFALSRPLKYQNDPPVSLHLSGCIYNFINGKFILFSNGMF
jgi:hypothetical protein